MTNPIERRPLSPQAADPAPQADEAPPVRVPSPIGVAGPPPSDAGPMDQDWVVLGASSSFEALGTDGNVLALNPTGEFIVIKEAELPYTISSIFRRLIGSPTIRTDPSMLVAKFKQTVLAGGECNPYILAYLIGHDQIDRNPDFLLFLQSKEMRLLLQQPALQPVIHTLLIRFLSREDNTTEGKWPACDWVEMRQIKEIYNHGPAAAEDKQLIDHLWQGKWDLLEPYLKECVDKLFSRLAGNRIGLDERNVLDLLFLAKKYEAHDLALECIFFLHSHGSMSNVSSQNKLFWQSEEGKELTGVLAELKGTSICLSYERQKVYVKFTNLTSNKEWQSLEKLAHFAPVQHLSFERTTRTLYDESCFLAELQTFLTKHKDIVSLEFLNSVGLQDKCLTGVSPYLKSLKSLSIHSRSLTTIPQEMSDQLEELDCSSCPLLVSVPTALPNCKSLNFKDCKSLKSLPASLPVCELLYCRGCEVLESVPVALPLCKTLDFKRCRSLVSLPASLPVCELLYCRGCEVLESVPVALPLCKTLNFNRCRSLVSLPASLPVCETLACFLCEALESVPVALPLCKTLDFNFCKRLKSVPASLPVCETLDCGGCEVLESVPVALPLCKTLDFNRCRSLVSLPASLPVCETLNCGGCEVLESVPAALPLCKTLNFNVCKRLKSVPASLPVCETLACFLCEALESVPVALPLCKTLDFNGCKRLKSVPASLPVCELLYCRGCEALESVPVALPLCKTLDFQFCRSLVSLPGSLPVCELLYCRGCEVLESVPVALPLCKTLDFQFCRSLVSLPASLPVCETLNCEDCVALESVPVALPRGESVNFTGCIRLRQMPEVPRRARVYVGRGGGSEFLQMDVDFERFANDPRGLLLELGRRFLLQGKPFPNIYYFEGGELSMVIDVGGVRRDLVTRLCEHLFKEGGFQLFGDYPCAKAEDKDAEDSYRTLGRLFALCYPENSYFKTGPLLSPKASSVFYQCLVSASELTPEKWFLSAYCAFNGFSPAACEVVDLNKPVPPLRETDRAALTYLIDELAKPYDQTYFEVNNHRERICKRVMEEAQGNDNLRAFYAIARGMHEDLGAQEWGVVVRCGAEPLQVRIEGQLTKAALLAKLQFKRGAVSEANEQKTQGFLWDWIERADPEHLRLFVRAITSNNTLGPNFLKIELYNRGEACVPCAHTCFFSLELSADYPNQATFDEKLEVLLTQGMAGTGFQNA